jgi:hypothetical protein
MVRRILLGLAFSAIILLSTTMFASADGWPPF